nr:polysaccharide deacetylase [Rhodococcus sp. (in: high G+C Gram-positive bacteria)]
MTETGPSHLDRNPPTPETAHWAKWASSEPQWNWPDAKKLAATFTFDVDAEAGMFSHDDSYFTRLSTLSEARFSVVRGVPRILEILRRFEIKTTFFIPGWTAENYPHAVEWILADGHEIGHHGYVHSRTDLVSVDAQREEIERGFKALELVGAPRPRGYRSTSWEMTPATVGLLQEYGFLYDSSFFTDDRPYLERHEDVEILELPSHWSLDDWPYFGYSLDHGGNSFTAETWRTNLWAEYQSARDDGRTVNYVCHPEIIGRGYRASMLSKLLGDIVEEGQAWIPTMEQLALHVQPLLSQASSLGREA